MFNGSLFKNQAGTDKKRLFALVLILSAIIHVLTYFFMFREVFGTVDEMSLFILGIADLCFIIGIVSQIPKLMPGARTVKLAIAYLITETLYRIFLIAYYLTPGTFWDFGVFVFQAPSIIILGFLLKEFRKVEGQQSLKSMGISSDFAGFLYKLGNVTIVMGILQLVLLPEIIFMDYLVYLTVYPVVIALILLRFSRYFMKM